LHKPKIALLSTHKVLINPQVHIATKEAYQGITPTLPDQYCQEILASPISTWKGKLKNDFEASLFPNYPILAQLKTQLYEAGAIYASMTGSGSTIYGIFEQEVAISIAKNHLLFKAWL